MDTRRIFVEHVDGGSDTHCVTAYEYVDGMLLLHLVNEDTGDKVGLMAYAPGAWRSTTEWKEDTTVPAPAPQTFKVGEMIVMVSQNGDGIRLSDRNHGWFLLDLRPDGVHLFSNIGNTAGVELESHDRRYGYLKTRWDQ